MKAKLTRVLSLLLALLLAWSLPVQAVYKNPYSDVQETDWSYPYISKLNEMGILPDQQTLGRTTVENRANFVSYLYGMHLSLGGREEYRKYLPFEDVPEDHPQRSAIIWAQRSGIIKGISDTQFAPDANITRQDACVMMMRFARYARLQIGQTAEAAQFVDSLKISGYARSDVAACQMSGVVNGYEDNFFRPVGKITREECAAIVWRLLNAADNGGEVISLEEGAYDSLYESFIPMPDPLAPEHDPVDLSYFDDTVFIGDSVSQTLEFYCAASAALGNAKFLCAGSLSASNALFPVTAESVHPYWNGEKVLVEDGVAASGAKKVYIMLGINNIGYGIDRSTEDMVKLIERILEKSPDVQIIIQSVTPMSESSTIITDGLNNYLIGQYNDRMKSICEERGWYFVNVKEVMENDEGWLIPDYCSDNSGMGIHFTFNAAAVWVEYLKTHVPQALMPEER